MNFGNVLSSQFVALHSKISGFNRHHSRAARIQFTLKLPHHYSDLSESQRTTNFTARLLGEDFFPHASIRTEGRPPPNIPGRKRNFLARPDSFWFSQVDRPSSSKLSAPKISHHPSRANWSQPSSRARMLSTDAGHQPHHSPTTDHGQPPHSNREYKPANCPPRYYTSLRASEDLFHPLPFGSRAVVVFLRLQWSVRNRAPSRTVRSCCPHSRRGPAPVLCHQRWWKRCRRPPVIIFCWSGRCRS